MRNGRFSGKKRYILLFVFGMMVFLYPTFSNLYYNYVTTRNLNIKIASASSISKGSSGRTDTGTGNTDNTVSDKEFRQIESDPSMKILLNKELDYLREYNKKLWTNSRDVTDPFGTDDKDTEKFQISKDNDGASVFAYIKIDKIHQLLPIYLGATDGHLYKGVAVIQGTSIPVGGENTNSVIAGHTGMIQKFFTDLPELKPGDVIEIINRWETLYYKVTGNKLIWPYQEEYLAVVPGKDIITLLTCYHGTPENDRLLVFAERYYPDQKAQDSKKDKTDKADGGNYSYLTKAELKVKPWYEKTQIFMIGAAVIMFGLFLYVFLRKANSKR